MPKLINANPSYRHHRPSDQAVVTIDGQDFYLGLWRSKVSRDQYDRVIGEWLANGRRLSPASGIGDLQVTELVDRFWTHALTYYRLPDGTSTLEPENFKPVLALLNRLYGPTPARDFGPLALEAIRNSMIDLGWCRSSINRQTARIRQVFKWGVSKGLVPANVHYALCSVSALRAGRSEATESEPVKPVADHVIDATLPFLSRTVAAMAQLQRLTGARGGEIFSLRTGDIDRSGNVWIYSPAQHKTAHHGHRRQIFVGPKAQEILKPFLKLDPTAYCFSPAEAEQERRDILHAERKTPMTCGNVPGSNCRRTPKIMPGERYTTSSYRRAIARAVDLADQRAKGGRIIANAERVIPQWHPHQLRHSSATEIRKRFGLEAAQHVLGHASLSMAELYADKNADVARQVAAKIG